MTIFSKIKSNPFPDASDGLDEVVPAFDKYPAKTREDGTPGISVLDHCLCAGRVAEYLRSLLPETVCCLLPDETPYFVSLHDIGKVSPGFQGKYFLSLLKRSSPHWAQKCNTCETNHADVGARAYMKIASVDQDDAVVRAIACHHGTMPQNIPFNTDGDRWQEERERLVAALATAFGVQGVTVYAKDKNGRLLAGLTCVSDWIASNEEYFPQNEPSPSVETVGRVLGQIGFSRVSMIRGKSFGDLFQDRKGSPFSPRSEQKSLMNVASSPGVYVMEATMGAGKTEAALSVAYNLISSGYNAGIYFALPTRLTSDRIYLRVQEFLDRVTDDGVPVRLSHGRAWLENYQVGGVGSEGRELPSWFAPSKRGLLYPFAVGTIDQALLATMNVRHSFVRLFGLAGKVVILDEVHSYDMYTGSLVESLVHDLRQVGCTVIILSATLTAKKRDALLGCLTPVDAPYPLVSGNVNGRLVLDAPRVDAIEKRVSLHRLDGVQGVVDEALLRASAGCNVLCVANSVRQAQRWYRLMKAAMPEGGVMVGLLHSRFPDFRRAEIEDDWMLALGKGDANRPHGSILISTQIVEQSVDIDADYLITELAPIDMLFQRMGRLWRHERGVRPVAEPICALAFDGTQPDSLGVSEDAFRASIGAGSCCVYAPYVLLRTLRVLVGRDGLSIPRDMRTLLEAVYAEQTEEPNSAAAQFKDELEKTRREMEGAAAAAGVAVTSLPARDDSENTPPTRYGSRRTIALLLVRSCDDGVGCGKARIELLNGECVCVDRLRRDFSVTKALYANTVSVPVSKVLGNQSREYEHKLLGCHFHAGEMPLLCRVEPDGRLMSVGTGADLGLTYRDDIGVFEAERLEENAGLENPSADEQASFDLGGADW